MKSKEVILAIIEVLFLLAAVLILIGSFGTGTPAVVLAPFVMMLVAFAIYFRLWRLYIVARSEIIVENVVLDSRIEGNVVENGHAKSTAH